MQNSVGSEEKDLSELFAFRGLKNKEGQANRWWPQFRKLLGVNDSCGFDPHSFRHKQICAGMAKWQTKYVYLGRHKKGQ